MLLLFALFICSFVSFCDTLHFFDINYGLNEWNEIQSNLRHHLTFGQWVNAWESIDYQPIYWRFCFWGVNSYLLRFFMGTMCFLSPGARGYRYLWEPSARKLHSWSQDTMCKIMNGKNLLLIGDSIQEEIFYALISSMSAYTIVPRRFLNDSKYINDKTANVADRCDTLCNDKRLNSCEGPVLIDCGDHKSFEIGFIRNDHLNPSDPPHWIDRISNFNPGLLFMNTGAHFLNTSLVLQNIKEAFTKIYTIYPNISIIYRNTPPGHPKCSETFNSPPLQSINYSDIMQDHPNYEWSKFESQNDAVEELIHKEFPQVLQLNYYTASELRADSHPAPDDCLHYCAHSVLETWVLFFNHALVTLHQFALFKKMHSSSGSSAVSSIKHFSENGLFHFSYVLRVLYLT